MSINDVLFDQNDMIVQIENLSALLKINNKKFKKKDAFVK